MRIRGRDRHDKPAFLNSVGTLLIAATLSLGTGAPTWAGLAVGWEDLPDPTAQTFEDPYRDLSPEQFDDVLFVVRLRGRLQQDVGTDEDRQKWQELLHETEDALAAGGVDVDWLLGQRQVVTERREKQPRLATPCMTGKRSRCPVSPFRLLRTRTGDPLSIWCPNGACAVICRRRRRTR